MYCTECGTNNRNDSKFCINCGAGLRDYTKPRQNLIMPSDAAKMYKTQKNRVMCIFAAAVLTAILFIASAAFLVFAFIQGLRTYFVIAGGVFTGLTLVCLIVQIIAYKRKES